MSRTAGPACELLLQRVWAQGGHAVPPDLAMQTLSRAQRLVNASLARVTAEATFTATALKLVYAYRTALTDAIDIISIQRPDGTAVLKAGSLDDLALYSPNWWRSTGTRIEYWKQEARDLLLLVPAHATDSTTLTVVYSVLTTDLASFAANYDTALQLTDDDVELALMLAEIILLLHTRAYAPAMALVEAAKPRLKPYLEG